VHAPTGDGWSFNAYRMARGLVAVWSTLSVLVVFLAGRRLFGDGVGLLAAALLAAFTRHVVAGGTFKPDTLVVLFTVLAFYKTLDLARDTGWRRFAVIGVAIGCAMAAKMTGVSAALPPVAAVAFLGWRRFELWLRLAFAAAVSFLTFTAFNPYLVKVVRTALHLSEGYESRALAEDSGHGTVFWRQFEFLGIHHGWVIFACALAGLAGLAFLARRRAEPLERRLGAFLIVVQVVGYSLIHGGGMTLFRGQNFLSVSPFTALAAAWAMAEAWRWLASRVRWLSRPAIAAAVWAVLGLWLLARPTMAVYREAIPSNWDAAWASLQDDLQPLALRQVAYVSNERQKRTLLEGRALAAILPAEGAQRAALLALSDAELLAEKDGFLAERRVSTPAVEERFASRPFEAQGESVILRRHPWSLDPTLSSPLPLAREGEAVAADLPAAARPGDVLALEILLPRNERWPGEVTVGSEALPVVTGGLRPKKSRYMTARFSLSAEGAQVRVTVPPRVEAQEVEVRVWRYLPPAAAEGR
jgi:4-amino-4-deoxy-L-arabinose transferase-like glycosyltransferase